MHLAVTGHRPNKLGGYGERVFTALVVTAQFELERLNPTSVATGMALGWDQAVAQACVNLGLPYYACVPFYGQERLWPKESQRRWNTLCEQAAAVRVIDEALDVDVAPKHAISRALLARNEYMVSRATHVLTLWDGEATGGTADAVRRAAFAKKPVINAWPTWLQFQRPKGLF